MMSLGVNHRGFNRLLSVRFYSQIVRAQLEYRLALAPVSGSHLKKLDACQAQCIRKTFRGSTRSSTKVMLHLINQPTMKKERVHILQAKFILRSIYLPDSTPVSLFLPHLRPSSSHSHWYKLSKNPIWQRYTASVEDDAYDSHAFTRSCNNYLEDNFNDRRNGTNSILLSACRPTLGVDPIFWLPMSNTERSRLARWRLGWLPGGAPKPYIYHPQSMFTKMHAIWYLNMHRRLQMPQTELDPVSFLLNKLPNKRPKRRPTLSDRAPLTFSAWTVRWPNICLFLFELDYLHHGKIPPDHPPPWY